MQNSLKMARWSNSSAYEISMFGDGVNDVSEETCNLVMLKIRQYARGAPVRAKVILVERTDVGDDRDVLGIVEINRTRYFLVITNTFLLVMDLHYARHEVIYRLLESTIQII